MADNSPLKHLLLQHRSTFSPVVPFDFNKVGVHIDLSINNAELEAIEPDNTPGWERYIWDYMKARQAEVAAGGYLEERSRYLRSSAYTSSGEPRIMHMGVDIWAAAGTGISAPLPGIVHSFKENAAFLDYGPTIILKHELEGVVFHTLYGHLSKASLSKQSVGKPIAQGECFAVLGDAEINGGWPPHLHFQLIVDMQGWEGDFPGLCTKSNLTKFSANCPDPNLVLGYLSLT